MTHRAQKTIVIKSSNTAELPHQLGECRASDRHLRGFARYTVSFQSQDLFLIWKITCLSSSFNSCSITESRGDVRLSTEINSNRVDQHSRTTTPIGWAPCLRQTAPRIYLVHGEFSISGLVSPTFQLFLGGNILTLTFNLCFLKINLTLTFNLFILKKNLTLTFNLSFFFKKWTLTWRLFQISKFLTLTSELNFFLSLALMRASEKLWHIMKAKTILGMKVMDSLG